MLACIDQDDIKKIDNIDTLFSEDLDVMSKKVLQKMQETAIEFRTKFAAKLLMMEMKK